MSKHTINVRLQWIYKFYVWAQRDAGLCSGVIGAEGPLTSLLLEQDKRSLENRRREKRWSGEALFPQCFGGIGKRASGPQYFATRDDKAKILGAISHSSSRFVRERDSLWTELTDRVGWRSGTLQGLLVSDFAVELCAEDGVARVRPSVQKFGYNKPFDVPGTLFARVNRYIELRRQFLAEHRWSEARAQHRLFLSAKTGRPLGSKTISQRFGKLFREIGVPAGRGAGHHSLRRKFGDQAAAVELESRRELGLSTAAEDVMQAVARKLGHESISSQRPYQRAVRSGVRRSQASAASERLAEVEARLAESEAENAVLRRRLESSERRPPAKQKHCTGGRRSALSSS